MIKNILFDMGGVLVRFDPDYFVRRTGITDPDDRLQLRREVYGSTDWVELDRGIIDDPIMIRRAEERLDPRLHPYIHELVSRWSSTHDEIPGMYELVEQLSRNYDLYLLTNASLRHHTYWPEYRVSEFFGENVFLSADYQLLKPDQEYFRRALGTFGLKPEECLFIDDSPANAESAMRTGIHAVVFYGDAGRLRKDLQKHHISIEQQG